MTPPFHRERVSVALPPSGEGPDAARLARLPELIRLAADDLARELGAHPEVVPTPPTTGARWIVRLGGPEPAHHLDRRAELLVTEAPTIDGLLDAFSTLRDLARLPDGTWPVRDCADVEELIERVRTTVADSWPSFALRSVDWGALCARHVPRVQQAADPVEAVRRWVAELGDAHTAVRPSDGGEGRLRYGLRLDPRGAVFWDVPEDSAAWRAGVRPGHPLVVDDPGAVWARTGASSHARPWVAGQSALRGPVGGELSLRARAPNGEVRWRERVPGPFDPPWIEAGALPSGAGYLRIHVWAPEAEPDLDQAMAALAGRDRLVVDLRGNGGGYLAMAWRFRDRFLRAETALGSICHTLPGGALGPWRPLHGAPPASGRWLGQVRFLTDERTFSSSEDALLGLQGLDHVAVWGRPSGGGSGRMRRVRLFPGLVLTIATALTRDRGQRVVESQGIPVDRRIAWTDPRVADPLPALADEGWGPAPR